ncbi:MAG: iron ABC transporter permease [Saccharofermentans sp.]|nr:iron ABC transporter permease [Saccharofermentans sp.]
MRPSTALASKHNSLLFVVFGALLCALFILSLFIGKYPLTIEGLISGSELQWRVFTTLRLSRVVVGLAGGFALGIAGFIFQTVFRNPLASPDIIGVSSGASAGAAAGILFFSSSIMVTLCAFGGALIAIVLAIAFSVIDRGGHKSTVVLAGIAVHAIAQTVLMCLKLVADPEKELASIEYWIMGSLNGINSHIIGSNLILCVVGLILLIMLHRQSILLSSSGDEAKMLGVDVTSMRLILLGLSTLVVSSIVSMTGLISFVGLLAPHCAKKLTGNNSVSTMILGGLIGSCILILADILARSVAATELPVSIFTSAIGAPFLVLLIFQGRKDT